MTTQEVLQQCIVEANIVRLPDIQLERKEYLEVKNALELIGGKWEGGKIQGFAFEEDPTDLLNAQASGEQRNLKKEYQFFATSEDLAIEMVAALPEVLTHHSVLEPSAGDGAIIKELFFNTGCTNVDCYEAMELNRIKLKKLNGINIIGDDFLTCDRFDYYDFIIANPPFTKNQDVIHIAKMYQCLKPGGTIVTLSSKSWMNGSQKLQKDFHMWLTELGAEVREIEEGRFKDSGTMVASLMITIVKPINNDKVVIPETIEKKLNVINNKAMPLCKPIANMPEECTDANQIVIRKCRVCGCTENDCRKCIKKTGKPCHWVEEDLCSACEIREPEEILKDIELSMKEADKAFAGLKKMLSQNYNDMNFFEQLSIAGDVDMTLRIMKKNDKLTLNIIPGSGQSRTLPIIITGTPQELDAEFFKALYPQIQEVSGIIHNMETVKSEANASKEKVYTKKSEKSADEKKSTSKNKKEGNKAKAKEPVAERASLFEEDEDITNTVKSDNDDQEDNEQAEDDAENDD